jgi:hypothetical protein
VARRPLFFCLLLFFLLAAAISPASAVEEIQKDHIKSFNLSAPEGLTFTGVSVSNIDPNSNTTIYLDSYGDIYILNVISTKSYLSKWNFNISLISPNGTVQYTTLSSIAPLATDYDLEIQYFWDSSFDNIFDIDIYTGILPLSATLTTGDPTVPANLPDNGVLQFTTVSTSSSSYFDLILYAATHEEYLDQLANNLWAPAKEVVSDSFNWAWDQVLSFVGLIPYIGDDLVTAILIASYIIDETFFYFNLFFVEYIEVTILTIEFFLITYSLNRTKTKSPVKMLKNVISDQIALFEWIIDKARLAIDLLTSIIRTIASIVQSLKPI